ncbi:histidine kinase [Phycicoccus sp.]|uniref:sensor histidine kinase n=1 Tax=Phycicoccus sp. TaxID=1902410 RepID=UPI002BC78BE2|nr:histidine kinase [Phycicoccus sp.]HMM95748.1 histidine kinase [Phycicoccus sp.]
MTTTIAERPVSAARGRWAGRALVGAVLGIALVTVLLDLRVDDRHRALLRLDPGWTAAPPALALVVAGALLLTRRPGNRLGTVLSGFGLWWAVDGLAAAWLALSTTTSPALPGATAAFTLYQRLGAGLLLALPLVLVLFPTGRWPVRRARWAAAVSVLAAGLLPLVLLAAPSRLAQAESGSGALPAPLAGVDLDPLTLPLPDGVWTVLLRTAYLLLPVSLVPALVVVVARHRRAGGRERAQGRWLVWAAVVDVLVMLAVAAVPALGGIGLTVAVAATAGAVAVAATDPGLVDVDRLLGDTLVLAVPVVASVLLDLLVLGGTSWLVGDRVEQREAFVLAVVVVVGLWLPLRSRLSRWVRRAIGGREDPYDVVAGLARRLEDSRTAHDELAAVTRAVARAVRTRWVGVEVASEDGTVLLVEHGERPEATRGLPVTYRGEQIGRLLLPASGVGTRLRPAEERLMADVVRQAAAAVRATLLAEALQDSRERLVTAVEDERRRLRRDLHDGLGPMLAAVATRIDTARITAPRDPEGADEVLRRARSDVTGMLGEVRRLVHGLRPPALDDVGLVGALAQHARAAAAGVEVDLEAGPGVDDLPAAVEVAAYRIVAEALANVGRHSGARRAVVRLGVSAGALELEVVDDGRGIEDGTAAGVGLVSLRERAAELGGSCSVGPGPGGRGTRVLARLPVGPGPGGQAGGRSSAPAARSTAGKEAP